MKKNIGRAGTAFGIPDFDAINERALQHIDDVVNYLEEHYLEGGKHVGIQFFALNPTRPDRNVGSFSLNTETGVWKDFATDDSGADVIGYWAFVKGIQRQSDAAKDLGAFLDNLDAPKISTMGKEGSQNEEAKTPVPVMLREAPKPASAPATALVSAQSSGKLWTALLPIPDDINFPSLPSSHPVLGSPVFSWYYRDFEGKLLGRIDAYGSPHEREFRPLTFWRNAEGQTEWRWYEFPEPWPLYGLELLAARPAAEVVICEGEEATDAARILLPGCVVVTTMYGGSSPEKTDFAPLHGRNVTIWPTNSSAGAAYADNMFERLSQLNPGNQIRTLKPICFWPQSVGQLTPVLGQRTELPDGWDAAYAEQEGWTSAHFGLIWSDPEFFVDSDADILNGRYQIKKSGVFEHREKDGKLHRVRICSYLKALAQTRDGNSTNWGLLLELTDADHAVHRWAMPRETLSTSGFPFVQTLVNQGLRMGFSDQAKADVARYLNEVIVNERALCVTQQGWYQQVFVTAEGMVGPSTELVVVQSAHPEGFKIFRREGTHADWTGTVAAFCQGNSRLVFSICAALTSPVLYWLGEENGGFHLRGNSSIGKTVALAVAVSVWGAPDFLQRWRATANGLEGTATKFNDTFLALDEISQVDATAAGEASYMLGNGQGKVRANTSGAARPVARWRLIFLSSGEVTLSDHSAAAGRKTLAGQEARMINIPADAGANLGLFNTIHSAPSPTNFAEMLRANAGAHFGTAGPMWIQLLADSVRREVALNQIREVKASFVRDFVTTEAAGQVFRAAGRFGLLAGVGEACIAAGILPWTSGEAIQAARECFLAWIEHRGGTESFEAEEAIRQVRRYIENHAESRFTPWEEMENGDGYNGLSRTVNRAGFRRRADDDSVRYYVFPEVFRREICQGMDPKEVAKVLVERGFLVPGSDGKPQSVQRLPGIAAATRIYLITSAILTGERSNQRSAPAPISVTQAA